MYVRFSGSAGNLNPVALNITDHLCLTLFLTVLLLLLLLLLVLLLTYVCSCFRCYCVAVFDNVIVA